VRPSFAEPARYARVNTSGTVNVLEAAQRAGVKQIVMASTSSVYSGDLPSNETEWVSPLSPYAASKLAAEVLTVPFARQFGMHVTILRLFNVYGPHGRPDMMPLKILNALWNNEPIQLYNEGKVQRDWTYIDDVVNGILAALQTPLGYCILNLGRGEPVYIQTLVDVLSKHAEVMPRIDYAPLPQGELESTWADITTARRCLGYAPTVSIYEGLRRTWEWFKLEKNSQMQRTGA
jgi:UDP-glucuronate 4-epimerase